LNVAPDFECNESPSDVLRAALATSEVCQSIHIVKVYIMDDYMWASAEHRVGPSDEDGDEDLGEEGEEDDDEE
jgi:hypothetical protein